MQQFHIRLEEKNIQHSEVLRGVVTGGGMVSTPPQFTSGTNQRT